MRARHPILALLCLVALAGAAAAATGPTVHRLSEAELTELAPAGAGKADCVLGNVNPPAGVVSDWFTGLESYAYLIVPTEQCSCPVGFQLESISMLLDFDASMAPVSFEAIGSLLEAVWDPVQGRWVPGAELCAGPPVIIEILDPGIHQITVPLDGCPCAAMDFPYFLVLHFGTSFLANLVIDGFPAQGVTYNDKGTGWTDLFDWFRKSSGKIITWGDVICCTDVVGDRPSTWGSVKSLYR